MSVEDGNAEDGNVSVEDGNMSVEDGNKEWMGTPAVDAEVPIFIRKLMIARRTRVTVVCGFTKKRAAELYTIYAESLKNCNCSLHNVDDMINIVC